MIFIISFAAGAAGAERHSAPRRIKYGKPDQIGVVADPRINESSGLARSIQNPGAFWTHNDSGGGPRLFLIDGAGKTLAVVSVEGASAVDWEDMASFRRGERGYLLIGDIGDNAVERKTYTLYLVPEPRIDPGGKPVTLTAKPALAIRFRYEDGPHNCESVAVDAAAGKIYLVAKRGGVECRVYEMPLPSEQPDEPMVARPIATLRIPTTTAMDISPDGLRAVVLTYGHAREYARAGGEPWAKAFARRERIIVMPRREQGESICYGPDGKSLYLSSEGKSQPLWEVAPLSR
jgi:hypothetical protein